LALDVVLPDGTLKKVDANNDADIFYALRGAAESFGIVTAFYLQTVAAPQTVVHWAYPLFGEGYANNINKGLTDAKATPLYVVAM